ncbi:ankyrin repeat domain-containing protein [archaeon]|nr:MAG: ankyrin repeat domain-containing protein [archaeon]
MQRNCTPLMLASEFNKTSMMQVLINHGADLNLQDDFGEYGALLFSWHTFKPHSLLF